MLIYLVGFMGCGKSYYGKKWADENNLHFFDVDKALELQEKSSISEIFSQKGEPYFRKVEHELLKTTQNYTNTIIACGGGTPCFFNNMDLMKSYGTVLFLNISAQTIFNNLQLQTQQRPILQQILSKNLPTFIQQKLAERLPFYLQSHIVIAEAQLKQKDFCFANIIHNI